MASYLLVLWNISLSLQFKFDIQNFSLYIAKPKFEEKQYCNEKTVVPNIYTSELKGCKLK